jgi:hypothetical protein
MFSNVSLPRAASALALCAMLLSIVGCTNRGTLPTTFGQQPSALQRGLSNEVSRTRGGAFSATYRGTYWIRNFKYCQIFRFRGSGTASFIQDSTEYGSLGFEQCRKHARAKLINTLNQDTITVAMSNWCEGGGSHHATFKVIKGTGRFAHVSGNGTVTSKCNNDGYSEHWVGTLRF